MYVTGVYISVGKIKTFTYCYVIRISNRVGWIYDGLAISDLCLCVGQNVSARIGWFAYQEVPA